MVKTKMTGIKRASSKRIKMASKPRTMWPGSLKHTTSPSRNQCYGENMSVASLREREREEIRGRNRHLQMPHLLQ